MIRNKDYHNIRLYKVMPDFVHFFYLSKEHRYDDFVCISRQSLSPYKLVPVRAGSGARLARREREDSSEQLDSGS